MAVSLDKADLRRKMRQMRHDQPREIALERSAEAQTLILSSSLWQKASTVALYMPTQGEIGTDLLFRDAIARGKALYLPRVVPGRRGAMFFVRVSGPEDLVSGAYGIMEPKPSLKGVGEADFHPDLALAAGITTAFLPAGLGVRALLWGCVMIFRPSGRSLRHPGTCA